MPDPVGGEFHRDLASLMLRYHPRAKSVNPQGNSLDLSNHWSVQLPLTRAIFETFQTDCELFSSPLNCSMESGVACCSPFAEDGRFGAVTDAFGYRWTGSCVANPEYTAEDMRKTVEHAIGSSLATDLPFVCALTLPVWDDAPWRSAGLLAHENVHHLLRVPAGRFRFVPASEHRESITLDPGSLPPAKWAVDMYLVANASGMGRYVDGCRLERTLVPAIRTACAFSDLHVELFPPAPPTARAPGCEPLRVPGLPAYKGCCPGPATEHELWPLDPCLGEAAKCPTPLQEIKPLVVIELCAGIATGLEALLRAGHFISSYSWADINPDAYEATAHRLERLRSRFPMQLPSSATEGWDARVPFNCNCLDPGEIKRCFPDGVDPVIAGPPCQPYSTAGKHKGLGDPRSGALLNAARLIQFLHATQEGGVRYIVENVPGTERHPEVARMLGRPVKLDAPPCGSASRRKTLFWQNLASPDLVQAAFDALPPPSHTVDEMLAKHGLSDWKAQPQELGYTCFPGDPYNVPGRPQVAIPKMVCYKGSHAFRFKRIRGRVLPGPGMLYKNGVLTEPDADVAEIFMGFHPGDTAAPGLASDQRRHLMGQCIDINLFSWLITTCSPRRSPAPPSGGGTLLARHRTPINSDRLECLMKAQRRLVGPAGIPVSDQVEGTHAGAMGPLPSVSAPGVPVGEPPHSRPLLHVANDWVYTDCSRCASSSALGASVVHVPTDTCLRFACTGRDECNTVFRAELVGIHAALREFRTLSPLLILSDCRAALQAVQACLHRPHERGYHHHRTLLAEICDILHGRDQEGLSTTLRKVRAHAGIEGNELADWHAKFAASNQDGTSEFPVHRHTLGAVPNRPEYWLYYDPDLKAPGQPDNNGRVLTEASQGRASQDHSVSTSSPLSKRSRAQDPPLSPDATPCQRRRGGRHASNGCSAFGLAEKEGAP